MTKYIWYSIEYIREKNVPISGKDMVKLFQRAGYEVVPGGKGSHIKLKKKDCPTIIVPNHKELKKGLELALKKALGKVK